MPPAPAGRAEAPPISESARGIADLDDGNGNSTLYGVYVMENGDKFLARSVNVVQTASGKRVARRAE